MSWLASLTLEDEGRQDSGQPLVVCEYEDVVGYIKVCHLHRFLSPQLMFFFHFE